MSRPLHRRRSFAHGFHLVESVMAVVLVSTLLIVSMRVLGLSKVSQVRAANVQNGVLLAEDLMAEITCKAYHDPQSTGQPIGSDGGEATRDTFDDVDDFDGHDETGLTDAWGNALPDAETYRRTVTVEWVSMYALNTPVSSDTGVKRIIVTVYAGAKQVATLTAYACDDWPTVNRNLTQEEL